jgi:ribosomal-protein-alanine N-acetyltransferase
MLFGERLSLRPLREADLDWFYDRYTDLRNRGDHYPLRIRSEPQLRRAFAEEGFWSDDEGVLLIVDPNRSGLGYIEFDRPVKYLDAYELSYLLLDPEATGHGYITEACRLLVDYLFQVKRINRLELRIHPDNLASIRVAEKCGFALEGTARGIWYHRGRHHDLHVYALLRTDWVPR